MLEVTYEKNSKHFLCEKKGKIEKKKQKTKLYYFAGLKERELLTPTLFGAGITNKDGEQFNEASIPLFMFNNSFRP